MNFSSMQSAQDLYGLYEITKAGKILYSRVRQRNALLNLQPEKVGKNLFEDVLLFDNALTFRRKVENFWDAMENTQTFTFNSQTSNRNLPIKVLLIRVNQSNHLSNEKFIIVDIRKSESSANLRIY